MTLIIDGVETDVVALVAPEYRAGVAACIASIRSRGDFIGVVDEAAISASGLPVSALSDALVPIAAAFALCPISQFHVGAVAQRGSRLYFGCNMEYCGGPISLSVHGEQAALSTAFSDPATDAAGLKLAAISVSAMPCGHCRQLLVEYGGSETAVRVAGKQPTTLGAILPCAFTHADLVLPSLPDPAKLVPPPGASRECVAGLCCEALAAAQRSKAMFSGCFSGAALQFGAFSGTVFAGAYVESAAYNPSMLPLNAAIVSARLAGRRLSDITRAVLVEAQAPFSYAALSRLQLSLIAPTAAFDSFVASFC